ncbi:hypothetical protein [Saccharopolyspora spinosa]|uniref:hypothetical protein n=1 Tax=Saccharopolyspora spinosa TaxID=60894 RepID=UPI00117B06AB|nr:hypothetical protein [Saccharopolyspora spinosa]
MVVHRRGSSLVTKEFRDLGKVLVTIDGLQALCDEIKRLDGDGDAPVMEFNGGTFDEAVDLRSLSDLESQQLAVKGKTVEVHLSRSSAEAVGDPETCEAVYGHWARSRQTKQRATRPRWHEILFALVFGSVGLLIFGRTIFLLLDWNATRLNPEGVPYSPLQLIVGAVVIFGMGAAFLYGAKVAIKETIGSYAIIRAVTEDEYRKERATTVRHWQTATIALAGVSATLLIGMLTLLFKR